MTVKVGCCGYPVSMKRYWEAFTLVELNNTFYQYPRESTVQKWRKNAPENFEFTVKANQEISHKHKLDIKLANEAFNKMKDICRTLDARILLIQTPSSFKQSILSRAEEFFRNVKRDDLTLIWETRGPSWENPGTRKKLKEVLSELDVTHVTDPFRILPVYTGRVAYFRLHGLGSRMYYYQYTDEELKKLFDLIKPYDKREKEVYVLFNNLSMFEDAKRFVYFLEEGQFPSLRGSTGLESVKAILAKMRFPVTKSMLIKRVGWRVIETEEGKQVRLGEILKNLPSKIYRSTKEITEEIVENV